MHKNLYVPLCQVSKEDLGRAVRLVLFNQIVVGIPVAMGVYQAMKWRGCSLLPDDLPTFHWALLELIICVLVEEICFYYSHRLDTKRGRENACVCVYAYWWRSAFTIHTGSTSRARERECVYECVCMCTDGRDLLLLFTQFGHREEESVTVCMCVHAFEDQLLLFTKVGHTESV